MKEIAEEYQVLIWLDFPTIYAIGKEKDNRLKLAL